MKNINDGLPILAIETSGEVCSVAVFVNEKVYSEVNLNIKNIHSEKIITLVEQALNNAKVKPGELSSIAISIGPGSFTGLRIGLATAKGLALGWRLPICPVNTMEAMALQISEFLKEGEEFFLALNANIEEAYLAKFKKEERGVKKILEIEPVKKNLVKEKVKGAITFGNVKAVEELKYFSQLRSIYVAKYAYFFGKDLVSFDFDYLEPCYFKEFLPGGKK